MRAIRPLVAALVFAAMLPAAAWARDAAMATVLGRAFTERELLPRSTRGLRKREYALNSLRRVAAANLLAARGASCPLAATADEVARYATWWRDGLIEQAARMDGIAAATKRRGGGDQLRGMAGRITPAQPTVAAKAKEAIERWRLARCVHQAYGGDGFLVPRTLAAFFSPGTDMASVVITEGVGDGLVRPGPPAMPEPTEAFGRLFTEALAKGEIAFTSVADRDYFMRRYSDPAFAAARLADVRSTFEQPYWMSATPPR